MISHSWLEIIFVVLSVGISIFIIDDCFIDSVALYLRVRPKQISLWDFEKNPVQKKIAIMVANWKEEDVLEQMILGNNRGIIYSEHHFFLGIYPNDYTTLSIARRLEEQFPNVHCVINSKPGPTSKGQMMNQIVDGILAFEKNVDYVFDLFVIHDSEDIIHPLSMKLFNMESERLDFIQLPIFSLSRRMSKFVAGTYMDEFSETHTKEMLVRDALGVAIPSAGVGTCVNRKLLMHTRTANNGEFLRSDSLTEDYVLGLQSRHAGFKCGFVCRFIIDFSTRGQIIATREFFPEGFMQSVKQKTRWTIGIVFQGWRIIGWTHSGLENYFLMRDRRGPLNSILSLFAMISMISVLIKPELFLNLLHTPFIYVFCINISGLIIRTIQRVRYYGLVYGTYPAPIILFRWPVAIVINAFASVRAIYQYYLSVFGFKKLVWSKTQHTLPKEFGQTA